MRFFMKSTNFRPASGPEMPFAVPARASRLRRGGQTLVEAALVLTGILLPLTLGVMQFGLVLNASNTMTQIAREGGRYAAVHGKEPTFDGAETAPAAGAQGSLKFYLKTVATQTSIGWNDIKDNIVVTPATRVSGQAVTVTVTYPMSKKVFLGAMGSLGLGSIAPGLGKLKDPYIASSTFVVE